MGGVVIVCREDGSDPLGRQFARFIPVPQKFTLLLRCKNRGSIYPSLVALRLTFQLTTNPIHHVDTSYSSFGAHRLTGDRCISRRSRGRGEQHTTPLSGTHHPPAPARRPFGQERAVNQIPPDTSSQPAVLPDR